VVWENGPRGKTEKGETDWASLGRELGFGPSWLGKIENFFNFQIFLQITNQFEFK
jgi:hypothetical protein